MGILLRVLPLLIVAVLIFIPIWKIVARTGLHPTWSLLILIPFLGYPALAVMVAMSPWPRLPGQSSEPVRGGTTLFALPPSVIVGMWGLLLVSLWASGRVLRRAGFSPWWALLLVVPLLNVILLWVFAFSSWPALDRAPRELVVSGLR